MERWRKASREKDSRWMEADNFRILMVMTGLVVSREVSLLSTMSVPKFGRKGMIG